METSRLLKKLGERIRDVRTKEGQTHAKVAHELGIDFLDDCL